MPEINHDDWFGTPERCDQCEDAAPDPETNAVECGACGGSGILERTAHGIDLVRLYPILDVRFLDRSPLYEDGYWRWAPDGSENAVRGVDRILSPGAFGWHGGQSPFGIATYPPESCAVHSDLFLIAGVNPTENRWWQRLRFNSAGEAVDTLGKAAIVWAHERGFEHGGPETPQRCWEALGIGCRAARYQYRLRRQTVRRRLDGYLPAAWHESLRAAATAARRRLTAAAALDRYLTEDFV